MYSQNNEEAIIKAYFEKNEPIHKHFLDIGANDGATLSNTAYLADEGWSGVCFEPSLPAYEKLCLRYANNEKVVCVPFGIATETKEIEFWESGTLLKQNDCSLVSTLYEKEKSRFSKSVEYKKITAQFYTWIDFVKEYEVPQKYAFVNIDAEGADLDILKQLPLGFFETQMFCVEWNSLYELAKEYKEICNSYGLYEISRNAENIIFAK